MSLTMYQRRGSRLFFAVQVATALFMATPGLGQSADQAGSAEKTDLSIMTLDLATAPDAPAPTPAVSLPSWRTTFGSERRSETRPKSEKARWDADVVLVQGVSDLRSLRRRFPPRTWRLIVSRQLLGIDGPLAVKSRDGMAKVAATAVAVRYQKGLRITGQDHVLSLSEPAGGTTQRNAAGTAVRIHSADKTIWLLSVDLPDACFSVPASCPHLNIVSQWKAAHSTAGETLVLGGGFAKPAPVGATCGWRGLSIFDGASKHDAGFVPAQADPKIGCTARAALPR